MGRPSKLAIDPALFAERWNDGVLLKYMAAEFGCSMGEISARAQRLGLPGRRRKNGKPADDERNLALVGGCWVRDGHGVWRWRTGAD